MVAEIGCRVGEHMKRLSLFILFKPHSGKIIKMHVGMKLGYFLFNFSLRFIITMSSNGVDDNAAPKTVADPTPEKAVMFAAPPP